MDKAHLYRGREVDGPVNEKQYVSRLRTTEPPPNGSWPAHLTPENGWPPCARRARN